MPEEDGSLACVKHLRRRLTCVMRRQILKITGPVAVAELNKDKT